MSELLIPFRHDYHKLKGGRFTTIRGKSWMAKVKEGDKVLCDTPTGRRTATVIHARQLRICDVRLTTLQRDAEYPGFKINSREDFVALINSLRSGHMPKAELESEVTVIMLEVKAPVDSMPPFALQT